MRTKKGYHILSTKQLIDTHIINSTLHSYCTSARQLTRSTFPINVRHPSFRTSARQCTDRNRVQHSTLRCCRTWRQFLAGIQTFILNTSQAARTIHVRSAFWLVRRWSGTLAVRQRVSNRQMFRASTACRMVLGIADSI
jgi:hypothetical protein